MHNSGRTGLRRRRAWGRARKWPNGFGFSDDVLHGHVVRSGGYGIYQACVKRKRKRSRLQRGQELVVKTASVPDAVAAPIGSKSRNDHKVDSAGRNASAMHGLVQPPSVFNQRIGMGERAGLHGRGTRRKARNNR